MDKEKAIELYEKAPLTTKFASYYKYSFTFEGENDVIKASLTYGGNADDIYRNSVDTNEVKEPKTFAELLENYHGIKITEKATGEVYDYYNY